MSGQGGNFPLLAKITNGGIAGLIGVGSTFPLDLVKTRLQNQLVGPNGEKMYANIFDCFRKVIKSEGFLGIYRGSAMAMVFVAPEKAFKLTANDFFCHILKTKDEKLPLPRQMLAGALTGVFQIVLTTPIELIKIQLQDAGRTTTETETGKKLTARSLYARLYKTKGILGLYKGMTPTACRDISFSTIYFPLFAALNIIGSRRPDGEAVAWWSLASGAVAGAISAVLVTPFDVIKTRIQVMHQNANNEICVKILDCARTTYKNEGPMAFFKGGFCRMFVIAPLFGITQMIYLLGIGEGIVKYFDETKS